MKLVLNTKETPDRKAISLTTYRALYIVFLLTEGTKAAEELLQAFLHDEILAKSCHKDTLTNSIKTLREAGFEIEKPKPSNKYRFKLQNLPFRFDISKDDIELLNIIRNSLYYHNNYKLIFKINAVYEELKKYIEEEALKDLLESSNHLRSINRELLNELLELCKIKATVRILYNSPVNGNEEIKIVARRVVFENKRLYLWLYSYKHQEPAYFRIDKILAAKQCEPVEDDALHPQDSLVKYEIWGNSAKNFIPTQNETILEQQEEKLIIGANVIIDFNFFQRIIMFADECRILEPEPIKQKYLAHLDKLTEIYADENTAH